VEIGCTAAHALSGKMDRQGANHLIAFLKHLIPIVEASFVSPIANIGPTGSHTTTGTVSPGIIYADRYFEIGVEALIPVNSSSGKHVGVVALLDFFLDDIFPDSIGRPLFAPAGFQDAKSPF
jgi:hypothetical protein